MGQPTPKSRFHLFLSWPCLISLALLLLNDYYLKPVLSNWLTGKLSDFAGIFLVSFLAFAMYPQRRKAVGFVLAVSFVLWKTEFVEPAIQLVQTIGVTRFGRVTDLTDVIALSVIPLAAWFAPRQRSCLVSYPRLRTLVTVPAVLIFVVAVTGTSIATFSENYIIQRSSSEVTVDPEGVLEVLNAVAHDHNLERISGDEESYSGEFSNKNL